MMSLKTDLLYKGVSYRCRPPVILEEGKKKKKKISVDDVMQAIIHARLIDLSEMLGSAVLRRNIEELITNLDLVKSSFKQTVIETASSRETGRSVARALQPQLDQLIPTELVGGKTNKRKIITNIMKTFLFGKNDCIQVSLLMDFLEVKKVVYTKTLRCFRLRKLMLLLLVKWLWQLAKRLVASCFYVSEMQKAPNQLTYVPKQVWQSESQKAFNTLEKSLQLVSSTKEAENLAKIKAPARLRFVPKASGLRPIISSRDESKSQTYKAKELVKSLLKKATKNIKTMHATWRHLLQLHQTGKKLYFVACDINDAFGSINQKLMIEILSEEIMRQRGPIGYRDCESEVCFIMNAVKYTTVKTLKKTYLLTKGLAQGMPLSAPLCNLYLAHMDNTCLSRFTNEEEDSLMRVVDDYLYITPDRSRAKLFLEQMMAGIGGYGIKINPSKTKTNLTEDLEILYCGYLLNTANLEVYVRYNAGITVSVRNSMGIKDNPIKLLEEKLVRSRQLKLARLTLDRGYMTVEGVTRNVFHTGCLLARQLNALLSLSRSSEILESEELANIVKRSVDAVSNKVIRVWRGQEQINNSQNIVQFIFTLRHREVKWVLLKAFAMILHLARAKPHMPAMLPLVVGQMAEVAQAKVRTQVLRVMLPVTASVPKQFLNWQDD